MNNKTNLTEFSKFIKLLPKTLEPHFIPIIKNGKEPDVIKGESWKLEKYRLNEAGARHRINAGLNVGIVADGEILAIDIDNPKMCPQLPDTLEVTTRNGRKHRLYLNGGDVENKDYLINREHVAEVRARWRYVLTPGSYVPPDEDAHAGADGLYRVSVETHPAVLNASDLPPELRGEKQSEQTTITPRTTHRNKYGNTLEEIRERDEKLNRLLNGDSGGYPSPSEADMATAQKLYFWGYDDGEIAGIIQTYRPRDKLKREDYLSMTISKIKRGEQVSGPINSDVTDILPHITENGKEGTEENVQTLKLQKNERLTPKYEKLVDEVLAEFNIITFTDTREMWIYDPEKGYYTDEAEPKIRIHLNNTLKKYYRKRDSIEVIHQVQNKTFRERLTTQPPDNLLNLENGILNLDTRQLTPNTPQYFFTSKWPASYDPDAKHGKFREYLKQLKLKKPKKLQRFAGYTLRPTNKYKKALLIHGMTDTGKTTFVRIMQKLIGAENYCSIGLQRLEQRFQLRRLYGKRLNIYGDLDSRAFTAISAFKTTTGSDPLEAEVKGSNKTILFTWEGKHIFIANALPEAKGEADADEFYNRLVLIEFTEQIKPENQDKNLVAKMTTPQELSDILNWALEGLDDLETNNGFDPEEIDKIRVHYKRAASPIYSFVQDHCEVDIKEATTKEESYTTFIKYCHHHELTPRGKTHFYEELLRHCPGIMSGRKTVNGKTPQAWTYLKLVNLELIEDAPPTPPEPQTQSITDYNTS